MYTTIGPAFSRADKMRFNTLTYEIIEELKMRRELAVENEKKIEKLINERFNLGWKLVSVFLSCLYICFNP